MINVLAINKYVDKYFPGFGLNKHHAIARLLHDISKNKNLKFQDILPEDIVRSKDFFQVRSYLLTLRYPSLTDADLASVPPLTELRFDEKDRVVLPSHIESPKKCFMRKVFPIRSCYKHFAQSLSTFHLRRS